MGLQNLLTTRSLYFVIAFTCGFGLIFGIFNKYLNDNAVGDDDNVLSIITDVVLKLLHTIVGTISLPVVGDVDIFGDTTIESPAWYKIPIALLLSIIELTAEINEPIISTVVLVIYGGAYTYIKFLFIDLCIPSIANNNWKISLGVVLGYLISNVSLIIFIYVLKNFVYLGVALVLFIDFATVMLGCVIDFSAACCCAQNKRMEGGNDYYPTMVF